MHLLIIPSWYPTRENPIQGVFFRDQALALRKTGHRVGVLVAPKLRSKRELFEVRRPADLRSRRTIENDLGIQTSRTSQWGWFPGFAPKFNTRLLVQAGLDTFEKYRMANGSPNVIHAHSTLYGGYLAVHIGTRWQIPVVLTEHSSAIMDIRIKPHQRDIVRETLKRADKVLAVSAGMAEALRGYCPSPEIEIMDNMVDTDFFRPADKVPPPQPFTFCAIAGLQPKKGLDILIRAFASVFRDQPVKLLIGGEGWLRDSLEALAQQLGIDSQVEFHGALSRDEVLETLQRSHSLVSSSLVETFGVTLIEAMVCGLPVVATRSGGPEGIVDEGNGILVPVGDADGLAAAMQQMVSDYQLFDPQRIREHCVAKYGEQAIVEKLDKIYRSLAARVSSNSD